MGDIMEGSLYCDQGYLNTIFKEERALICDLDEYEHISRNAAVSGNALISVVSLLGKLVTLNKHAEFPHSQIKAAALHLLRSEPTLNKSGFTNKVWAGFRAERVCCILYHVRRVARDDYRMNQMMSKMTGSTFQQLCTTVLDKVVVLSPQKVANKNSSKVGCSDSQASTMSYPSILSSGDATDKVIDEAGSLRNSLCLGPGGKAKAKANTKAEGQVKNMPSHGMAQAKQKAKAFDDKNLLVMYYKRSNSYGIRVSGGKQIMSVTKRGCEKEALHTLAKRARKSLEQGSDLEEVKMLVPMKFESMPVDHV